MQTNRSTSLIYEQDYAEWLEITLRHLECRNLENIDCPYAIADVLEHDLEVGKQ